MVVPRWTPSPSWTLRQLGTRTQDTACLSGGGEDLEGEWRLVAPVVSLKAGEVVVDRCSCRVEIAIGHAKERQLAVIDDGV